MVLGIPQHFKPYSFILDRGEVDLLVISGPDSADFLNRLSTLNFKKPIEGSMHGAFLNGQAKLISLFTVWKKDDKNYFFIEKEMFEKTKSYLEQMHFAENMKIETEKYFALEARGETHFLSEIKVEAYNWGMPGKYFFSKKPFDLKSVSQSEYDAIRASFGFPKPLQDLTEDHILIEAPLDSWVDRNKGCYPGQEVIEKIYTYGRVSKKIKKITFENAKESDIANLKKSLPLEIEAEGNKIGTLSSVYHRDGDFGLVTLKRIYYEKHKNLEITQNGTTLKARIEEN